MSTWVMLRAAGVGSYLLLFASITWGLIATTALVGKRIPKARAILIHQFLSVPAMVLLLLHLGGLLVDRYVPFGAVDLLVPFSTGYRSWGVALGIVAMYSMVVVIVSSWLRKHVGVKMWRRLHMLAVPSFALAMVHGVMAGSDSSDPWMWAMYATTGGAVFFLTLFRALTLRPKSAASAPGSKRIKEPGRLALSEAGASSVSSSHENERPDHRGRGIDSAAAGKGALAGGL